jgi:uncharacterized protein YecE (DUF72 family)
MPIRIGTSGWHYLPWKGHFYPTGVGTGQWLGFYSERFATVESNNAFYRLPDRETFAKWRDATPSDFLMAVKASRYLTHVRRLQDPAEPVARLMDRVEGLGPRLGPILLQLPPTLKMDLSRLDSTLRAFPRHVRVAVEPRHESWFVKEVRAVLERRGAALCLADGGPVETPQWRTTEWGYLRFHRGGGRPRPCYLRRELESWADALCSRWPARADVFCFFNNDTNGCALRDARWFALACTQRGRVTTRVPDAREGRHF